MAEAVAEAKLAEPRVRDAVKVMREQGVSPTEAVRRVAPRPMVMPLYPNEVASFLRKRLDAFLDEPMRFKEHDLDFWEGIGIAMDATGSIEVAALARTLSETAVKFEDAATRLLNAEVARAVKAVGP